MIDVQFVLFLFGHRSSNHRIYAEVIALEDLTVGSKVYVTFVVYKLKNVLVRSFVIIAEEGLVLGIYNGVESGQLILAFGSGKFIGILAWVDIFLIQLEGLFAILVYSFFEAIIKILDFAF